MGYFNNYHKNYFKNHKIKNNSFIYELALSRGQKRGWYPYDWTIKDYERYLFRNSLINEL